MTGDIVPIVEYTFTSTDRLLLDANIWLFMYGRQDPKDSRIPIYSRAFANILNAKSRIFLDVLVLSEFINRYSRIEHNIVKDSHGPKEFKRFRKSPEFKTVAEDIVTASRQILKHCKRTGSGFESVDINAILTDYKERCPDFNDQMLVEICKTKGLKLVTHDGDFKHCGLILLTANKNILLKN